MKRLLVFSDTHGYIDKCIRILNNMLGVDMVIHLGDTVSDAEDISSCFPDIEMVCVAGNNDFFARQPYERIVTVDGVSLFLTHGHHIRSEQDLVDKAKANNCQFALFGHTHIGVHKYEDGICLLNPGSLSRPRDNSPSYGVIELDQDYAKACIIPIK